MNMRRYIHIFSCMLVTAVIFVVTGCSGADSPNNLEPVITVTEATDVTRTEATLSARIEKHGTVDLAYIHFVYGVDGSDGIKSANLTPVDGGISLNLTDLLPGTTYFYYAEGGTTTATVRSERMSFTTVPNDLPSISEAKMLSSGPVGLIVEFEITDDGGEALLDAGCEIRNTAANTVTRINLTPDALKEGVHRQRITGLSVLTEYVITPFAVNSIGEAKGEALTYTTRNSIVLTEGGSLPLIFADTQVDIESMVVSGEMNGDDFRFLRRALSAPILPGETKMVSRVTEVDLADVNIVGGGGSYDGARFTSPDTLSTGIFADCTALHRLVLPASATVLMRDALANCTSLKSLTIPAGIKQLLPSSGCTSLETIEVSAANDNYKSHEGVLFNHGLTEILWFPVGKKGAFTLPASVTSIAESAFKGTAITSLTIPDNVKTIARGAFSGSVLEEIVLPDIVTNVSEGMFQNCSSLRTVRLGRDVNFIGDYVVDGCPLERLYINAVVPPVVSEAAFPARDYDIFRKCTLHVPEVSLMIYRNHDAWGKFENIRGI